MPELRKLTLNGVAYDIVDETARSHTHRFDDNITGGSTNDTVAFWVEKGPGYCWISEVDQVANQPNQYGFLISYVNEGDVFQIFRDQTEGMTYHRSGDSINGWFGNWARVITADGNDNINLNGVITRCVEVGDSNSQMGLYTNGLGSRSENVWIDQAGDAYFTEVNIGTPGNYKKAASETEDWTFTLEDGSTVTKKVYVG